MPKIRRKRKSYTPQQRSTILEAAVRQHLTANQVLRKFGVTPVTYYSWRKKMGATRKRGSVVLAARGAVGSSELTSTVRLAVAQRVREILPNIVRSEVGSYLNTLFANGRGKRRTHRV